jgi:GT2 family glycosyltransferase
VTLQTPVALIIFNRPESAARVFAEIAKVKPRRLFVFADGPRPSRVRDAELCAAARQVVERVDWDCEVTRDFAPVNLGPHRRIVSGLNAAFQQVEDLIVLEDDCVPHPTFFRFCEELLEQYRHDERVMHIAGTHLQAQNRRSTPYSYTFSRWNLVWGWATWRRAWQHFDLEVRRWPEVRETSFLTDFLKDARAVKEYRGFFDDLYNRPGRNDGWDYAWSFACWSQSGFTLLPSTTLVENIGFGPDSTHFPGRPDDPRGRLTAEAMLFPLVDPPCVVQDREADDFIIQHCVIQPQPSVLGRLYMFVHRLLTTAAAPARKVLAFARSVIGIWP